MRHEEFTEVCRAVEAGSNVFVQNVDSFYTGVVVACGKGPEDSVTVEAFGHRHDWDAGHCRRVDGEGSPLGPPTSE